jgi:peroxiredoxin
MKMRPFIAIAVFGLVVISYAAIAANASDAKGELSALTTKIRTKLQKGSTSEADLAPEIKEFDDLLAKHKDEKTDDVARVLLMKAMLYEQVLGKPEKAKELLAQLKKDYPDTKPGQEVDRILESMKVQEEAKKIQASLVEGTKFPEFEEKDLAGKPLSIVNYRGKVVLLDFWATWCAPCVHELPNVLQTYEKYHKQGFEIIGISLDQDKNKLTNFIKDKDVAWPQFFDGKGWENKLAVKYGVKSIPATILLNGEGTIIGKDLQGEALEEAVGKALAKK